jgi:hypothetical protein
MNECSTVIRPQPAAARRRWYSMIWSVTFPSGPACPDHMGGMTMRLRSVSPAKEREAHVQQTSGGCCHKTSRQCAAGNQAARHPRSTYGPSATDLANFLVNCGELVHVDHLRGGSGGGPRSVVRLHSLRVWAKRTPTDIDNIIAAFSALAL